MKRKLLFAVMTLITGAWALSASAQEDVTSTYLSNADLATQNAGWTQSGYTAWVVNGAVPVVEFWNWSSQFSFTQTVTLPAGNYRIAVNSFYRNSWGGDGTNNDMAWIFAGEQKKNVVALNSMNDLSGYAGSNDLYRAATAFSQGKFSNEFDFDLTEESTIELGFKGTCPNGGWCILGPVKLYKYSLEDYLVDYRAKVAEAQTLNEADMFPAAWENLQAAIVDESTFNLVSEVTAAINTLSAAINAANTSIAVKASAEIKLAHMKEVVDATNFYTADLVESYYGQWQTKYDNGTITEAEANALQDPFATTGVRAAVTVDELLLPVWTYNGTQCNNFDTNLYINSWSVEGNSDGTNFKTPFFEYWVGDANSLGAATLQATLIGLTPNQLYSVDLWARVRQTNGQTKVAGGIVMQAGDGPTVDLTAGTQVGSGPFYIANFTAVGAADADGKLILTITVAENSNVSWLSFKNAKYEELDDERIPYATQLAAVVAQAQSLAPTLVVPDGVKSALTATAATYEGYTYSSLATVAEFEAAIAEVNTAIADAQAAEASYAQYLTLKGYADALLDVDYVDLVANAHANFAAAVVEPTLNTKADIDAAYDALNTATMTYIADAEPAAGQAFDLTFMLTNPDVTSFWDGSTWGVVPSGWYTDQNPADNFQVMANEEMGPGGEVFIEYWSGTPKTSNFVLYQKATLPEGTYKMTGRVGLQQNVNGDVANITFSANETDGTQIAVGPLSDQEVEFINSTTQEVKIGIKAQTGNCYRWIGINKIKMYKLPTDKTEYAITTETLNAAVNVTVEGNPVTTAKRLDPVVFEITVEAGAVLDSYSVTYVDADNATQTITPTDLGENKYTFQMPKFPVTIAVTAVVDKTALEAAIAAADIDASTVPADVYAPYATALSTAQTIYAKADATVAEVASATTNLVNATASVKGYIVAKEQYDDLKAYADALVAVPNDDAAANGDLADAISDAAARIAGETDATGVEGVTSNLRLAMDTYVAAANPTDEAQPFNLTYMLTNPDVTDFYTGDHGAKVPGWDTEMEDGNSQVVPGETVTADDGIHKYAYEYWSDPAKANDLFALYQLVTLPAGTYKMSCYAFASANGVEGATVNGVYFYANETQGSQAKSDHLSFQEVEFVNAAAQDVKIGLKTITGNQFRWMGIGYLELYKTRSKFIEITEGDTYDNTQEMACDVDLYRSVKVGLNTLVLPFSLTQAEVETFFGADSKVYEVTAFENDNISLDTREGLAANQPVILKATKAIAATECIAIEGRTLVAGDPIVSFGALEFVGIYAPASDIRNTTYESYVISNDKLYHVNSSVSLMATRAYFRTPQANGVKALTLSFDGGEATGIATLENGELNVLEGKAYDLSGREVKNPTKGLYIIGGKKVLLK